MKIQICSDVHLEFASNREWLEEHPLVPKADILIIAGDTYYLNKDFSALDFIQKVSQDFKQVYLIPGNHEYYGGYNVATAFDVTYEKILDNVFMVNNHTVEIDNIQFIFSTMWSKIQHHILDVMRGMTDFHRIKFNGERFSVNHYNEIHEVCFQYIFDAVKKEGKKVVVTHHLPSYQCNVEEFKDSLLNDAFCVDKTPFILNHDVDYWVYGHSHRNLGDFNIGNTKMVTNQLGYVGMHEHYGFDTEKVIEIT
ncbi:metallophosphoesterase [Aureisphaera galaxeae]|uniref:metallophosphoesterase n=1 Tax=Aureisphaera galaxeae TaxID=1538023 RepID=UPI002350598D|nr:metallophosphoesterase [Aureisphaera galaxeae]MDC8006078.1 metallophosphoesterase [Aureisphaera galaxeae]